MGGTDPCGVIGISCDPAVEGLDEPSEMYDAFDGLEVCPVGLWILSFFDLLSRDLRRLTSGSDVMVSGLRSPCSSVPVDGPGLWRGCLVGTGGDVAETFGGEFLGSKVELVGVSAVDTSDTESFLITNCAGDTGGDVELSDFRFGSFMSAGADGMGVVSGGSGKSGIADRGAMSMDVSAFADIESFRRGISSSFHSASVVPALEFFRRERRDIFRPRASPASFAMELMDVLR